MEEEKLDFGSVSSPVKVGDTVHRQAGPWTPTIHALLHFLNKKGLTFVPRSLGFDDQGREVLKFLPGKAATRPWPTILFSDGGLIQAAKMLCEYHDAVESFQPSEDAQWRIGKMEKLPGQIIRHGDLGPWNTLWQEDKLTGIIDWDFAEPGERITDLAQMAYYFVPLRGEKGWLQAGFVERPDLHERLNVLCQSYGSFKADDVLRGALDWLEEELRRVRELGGNNIEPWASFLYRGDAEEIVSDIDWLKTFEESRHD